MNPIPLIPAFRIEISEEGSGDAWFIADLAHTQLHAKAMIVRWQKEEGIEARVVPNRQPIGALYPGAEVSTESLRTRGLLTLERPAPVNAAPAVAAAAPVTAAPAALEATPAPEPEAEIPFAVGDRLQDQNSEHPELRVTEVVTRGPRPGFAWECPEHPNPGDRKGFCPAVAMGYFKLHSAKAKKGRGKKSAHAAAPKNAPDTPAAKPKRSHTRKGHS